MKGVARKGMQAGGAWKGLLCCFLLSLGACAPGAGLYTLPAGGGGTPSLSDDLGFRDLPAAVHQSVSYYRRVRPEKVFRYGELEYTAREMEASARLFLDIVENLEGEARRRSLREKFHFFESRNDSGAAFFTGYYEPLLEGSLKWSEKYPAPLYAVPADLLTIDLTPWIETGLLPEDLENKKLRGRAGGRGVVPYDDREQIYYGASLEERAEVLAWVEDHVELAFLQIQGSGLIRLEDGSRLRVNYADQNGHPYRAIGRLLLDSIPREEMSLQRIRDYLRRHPGEVREILNYNPSYTFFRLVEEGPLGNIEVPLTPGRSVAMDHRLVPGGGLVYFETSYPPGSFPGIAGAVPFSRFGVVQDTGGAIRGHGRVDVFWGSGKEAEMIAGPMKEKGRVFLLAARKEYLAESLAADSEEALHELFEASSRREASHPGTIERNAAGKGGDGKEKEEKGTAEAGLLSLFHALFAFLRGA
jgi:membrane-bound lytic murein transglycosylase A